MATAFHAPPPTLQEALRAPVAERRGWQDDLAPSYIGLFLLIVYYDQLAQQTLSIGGLSWSLLGAGIGGLLCFVLLYYVPALWGLKARQPLAVVSTSTFGASGAPWVPGLVMAAAQVVWFAVVVSTAADVALRGLVAGGLVPAQAMRSVHLASVSVRSPLFLFVTLVWSLSAALIGIWLVRLVAATMKVYAVFPAVALGIVMVWAMPGLGHFRLLDQNPVTSEPASQGGVLALLMMVQLIFGFFATSGAAAADWGAYSRDLSDVRLGGLVGVAFAAWILAAVPLLAVAGAVGRSEAALAQQAENQRGIRPNVVFDATHPQGVPDIRMRSEPRSLGPDDYTLSVQIQQGIGGVPACVLLLVFGLALLGPTCFTPFVFSQRLAAVAPGVPRWAASALAALLAWPLIAIGVPQRIDLVFGLLGAAVAPVVGAMAADYLGSRGEWPGPRRGVNLAGVAAWVVGLLVGLIPYLGWIADQPRMRQLQPAAVLAFVAAFVVYGAFARMGLQRPRLELPTITDQPAEPGPQPAEPQPA